MSGSFRRKALGLSVAAAIFSPVWTWAASGGRVAVVDLQKIIELSRRGQQAREKFKSEILKRQKEVEKYEGELKQLDEDYQKKAASLSGDEREAYQARFRVRVTELKRKGEDIKDELNRAQQKLTDAIVEDVQRLAQVYARRQGYGLVLEAHAADGGYIDSSVDITQPVLDLYDSEAGREETKK